MTRNDRGITLIELLAVLAIIGVVTSLLLAAQSSWTRGTADLQQQMVNQDKLRFAVETLVRDIEQSVSVSKVDADPVPVEGPYTESVEITSMDGVVSTYRFDPEAGTFSLERGSVNVTLVVNLENFQLTGPTASRYTLDFRLMDIDARTGSGYQIVTTVRPITWN